MGNIEDKLINGNKRFLNKIGAETELKCKINELIKGQNPYAIVVCCSDSRVVPETIFDVSVGEIFVIRTAGNVINEGELASIEYGIEHLHIKCCIVLGHTLCGAVHAAIHGETGKYLRPILDNIASSIGNEKDPTQASILNADSQVDYLKSKFPDSDCLFISALYKTETGLVCINKK